MNHDRFSIRRLIGSSFIAAATLAASAMSPGMALAEPPTVLTAATVDRNNPSVAGHAYALVRTLDRTESLLLHFEPGRLPSFDTLEGGGGRMLRMVQGNPVAIAAEDARVFAVLEDVAATPPPGFPTPPPRERRVITFVAQKSAGGFVSLPPGNPDSLPNLPGDGEFAAFSAGGGELWSAIARSGKEGVRLSVFALAESEWIEVRMPPEFSGDPTPQIVQIASGPNRAVVLAKHAASDGVRWTITTIHRSDPVPSAAPQTAPPTGTDSQPVAPPKASFYANSQQISGPLLATLNRAEPVAISLHGDSLAISLLRAADASEIETCSVSVNSVNGPLRTISSRLEVPAMPANLATPKETAAPSSAPPQQSQRRVSVTMTPGTPNELIAGAGRVFAIEWTEKPKPDPKDRPRAGGVVLAADDMRVVEGSLATGRLLSAGPVERSSPVGSADFLFVVGVCGYVAVSALVMVFGRGSRPGEVLLPENTSLTDAWRRAVAGSIDLAVVALIAARLSGFSFAELNLENWLTMLFLTDAGRNTLLLTLGLGCLIGTIFEALTGRTLGKTLTGCVVVRMPRAPAAAAAGRGKGSEDPTQPTEAMWDSLEVTQSFVRNAVKWFLPAVALAGMLSNAARHVGDVWSGGVVATPLPEEDYDSPED